MTPDVLVASVNNGDSVKATFHASMVHLLSYDSRHYHRIADVLTVRAPADDLAGARNAVARQFMATSASWLLSVDSDAGFAPDVLDRLLEVRRGVQRTVMGALAFAVRLEVSDGAHGWRPQIAPVLFRYRDTGTGSYDCVSDYPVDQLVEVDATGMHCLLIHRSVLEAVGDNPYSRMAIADGRMLSEDLSFCRRVRDKGIRIHVHTGIKTTHVKNMWISEDDYALQALVAMATAK